MVVDQPLKLFHPPAQAVEVGPSLSAADQRLGPGSGPSTRCLDLRLGCLAPPGRGRLLDTLQSPGDLVITAKRPAQRRKVLAGPRNAFLVWPQERLVVGQHETALSGLLVDQRGEQCTAFFRGRL